MVKRSIADIKEINLCNDIERLAELIGWRCKCENRSLTFDTHYSDAHPFWMVKSAEMCFRKLGNEHLSEDEKVSVRKNIDKITLTFLDWATMTATKDNAVVEYNHGLLRLYITIKNEKLCETECKFGIKGTDFVFNSMVRCALSVCRWCGRYYGLLSDGIGGWFGLPAETFASLQCLIRTSDDCRIRFYV